MSNSVDRRIVEMQFDNKDFENRVQSSVKSLDKLKKSLDLEESAKGLSALEKAGNRFSLDGMVRAAEAVTSKFSIMGTIGDQVLRRIGDAAFNAIAKMKNLVESLTIDPISTGLQEYETQINSIQTILSNTYDSMAKQGITDPTERVAIVNDRLDQLNHYADKTIYNFTQMTESIGKFTAAGVDLDSSVAAIQGIANLAAVSGSTADQASNAMYMLSQAMSSGTITLYHWNSVVRAGMGGEVFQKSLIRTATALGKTVDVTVEEVDKAGKKVKKTVKRTIKDIVEEEGFRESLSHGWLTSDILTASLDQFSWDFEQMAKDLGYAKEDMEEGIAKAMESKRGELLSKGYSLEEADEIIRLAKDATEAATKVKTLTQLFDTLKEAAQSGWTETWRYIIGDFEEAKELFTGISDFFGNIIGEAAEARNKIVKEWRDAGGRDMLWNNDETKGPLGAFWNLVYGVKNIIRMIREEFQKVFPPATSKTLLTFTQRIQQATSSFKAWTENSEGMDKIRRIVAGIAAGFGIVKTAIGYVLQGVKKLIGVGKPAVGGILGFAAGIGDLLVKAKESIKTSEKVQNFLRGIGTTITAVRGVVAKALKTVITLVSKLWGKVKSSGVLTKIGDGISNLVARIPNAINKVKDWIKIIAEYIKNSETLRKTWDNIKKFFTPVLKGFGDFGKRLKEALGKFFDKDVSGEESMWGRLKSRLMAFGSAFSDWFTTVKTAVSNAWTKIKEFLIGFFTKTIPGFFNSKKIDASSILNKVKTVDWGQILKAVLGVATFVEIFKIVRNFSKIGKIADSFKNLTKTVKNIAKNGASLTKDGLFINGKKKSPIADTLLKVAASIGILVGSIYVLAKMDANSLKKGIGLLTLLASELLIVSALFSMMKLDGSSVLKAAAAVMLLVIPIKILSAMKTGDALKGILGVGLILAELALFSRLMGKEFKGKQAGFIGLGIAVNLLVIAIKKLSKLSVGSLTKSLVAMEVVLLEMAAFTKRVSKKKVAGMITMAISINLMVTAVKRMGKLDTRSIIKGVIGLGGIMLAFGAMLKLSGGVNFGSALILLLTMAGSLLMITEAFKRIDGSNSDDMLKFATSFAAMMIPMSIALKVLSSIPIVGALKGVANLAILVVGVGALAIGLGYLQSKWKGMTGFLESGGEVLGQIGSALGKFVGGIGAGIVEGLNLPQLGSDLSDFMKNSEGFIEGAKSVDTSAASGVGNLTAAIIKIAGAEFVSALVTLFTGENPITKFSDDLVALGQGLSAYAISVLPLSLVPQAVLDRSIAVASSLADVAKKIPATGGVMALLNGIGDLGDFGNNLISLGSGLTSFALEISAIEDDKFNQKKVDALVAVATGLATLESNLEGQGGFEDVFAGVQSLAKFSEGFTPFATGLNAFITEVKQISYDPETDGEKMTAVIAIATSLSELEKNLQGQKGLAQAIAGVKSLDMFGDKISPFAKGLNGFITEVRDIKYAPDGEDAEKMSAVIAIATSLAELEKSLQGQKGLAQAITGVKSLDMFGDKIPHFAGGLNDFITEIRGVEYDSSEGSEDQKKLASIIAIAQTLAEFEKTLEAQGGWADNILGSKDLGQFAGNIKVLGEALSSYMKDIQGANLDDNNGAVDALLVIKDFIDGLDPSGSFWQSFVSFFTGDQFKTLDSITSAMADFGTSFTIFADGVAKSDSAIDQFENAKTLFNSIKTFNDEVNDSGPIDTWSLQNLLGVVAQCGVSLAEFHDGMGDTPVENLSLAATAINAIVQALKTVSSIPNLSVDPIQTLLNNFSQITIPEFNNEGLESAKAFINSLTEGIDGAVAITAITNSATRLSEEGSSASEGTYKTWYASGEYLAAGLGNGISSMAESVRISAVSVAAGAIRAIQIAWSIHSPSKVGADLGMYFDLGIAGGLDSYAKVVSSSAAGVGRSVVDSASTMLRGVDGSIFDNLDPNPTIRPVIDLTNVQNGINAINGMLDPTNMQAIGLFRGMNLSRGINALNMDGAKIMGGLTDKNVVSKLDELQERIGELGEAVTNMKIVLDSGVLVGATSSMMDDQLGTLEMRKRRGN